VEDGPSKTYPAPDLENMKEVIKKDRYMKEVYQRELGEDFESFKNGVCTGEARSGAMHPFDSTLPWPEREKNDV
jgi:hypothetical protein